MYRILILHAQNAAAMNSVLMYLSPIDANHVFTTMAKDPDHAQALGNIAL
jgi:hypothetical protein